MSTITVQDTPQSIISVQPIISTVVTAFPAGLKGDKGNDSSITVTAPFAISSNRAVCFENGVLAYAQANNTNEVLGFTTGAASENTPVTIQTSGELGGFFNLIVGLPVFLSDNGVVTQTIPVANRLQKLGIAVSESAVSIEIQLPFYLLDYNTTPALPPVNLDAIYTSDIAPNVGYNLFSGTESIPLNFVGTHANTGYMSTTNASIQRGHDKTPRWSLLQPVGRGLYDATQAANLDAWLTLAKSRGCETIYTVLETPTWASARPTEYNSLYHDHIAGGLAEPANMQDLHDFVTWLMTNYGNKIDYLEVWNEPKYDTSAGSSFFSGTPEKLAEMTRTINLAAKAVKPTVKIMGWGCTNLRSAGGFPASKSAMQWHNGYDYTYLAMEASDGHGGKGKDWLDIISMHPYIGAWVSDFQVFTNVVRQSTVALQARCNTNLPVWASEYGHIRWNEFDVGTFEQRVNWHILYIIYTIIWGYDRSVWYAYDSGFMGWVQNRTPQERAIGDDIWNTWVDRIQGGTLTCFNRLNDGRHTCVIDGQPYIIDVPIKFLSYQP